MAGLRPLSTSVGLLARLAEPGDNEAWRGFPSAWKPVLWPYRTAKWSPPSANRRGWVGSQNWRSASHSLGPATTPRTVGDSAGTDRAASGSRRVTSRAKASGRTPFRSRVTRQILKVPMG